MNDVIKTHGRRSRSAILSIPIAVGFLLLCPGGANAEPSVTLADNRVLQQVTVKPGAAPDRLRLEPAGKPAVEIAIQDLVAMDFGRVSGRGAVPSVRLVNGDTVSGRVTFPSPRQVKVAAGWGSITIPFAWCSAVRLGEKAPLPEPAPRDTLFLANDRVQGEIRGVAADKVTVEIAGKPVMLEVSRVLAFALGPRDRGSVEANGVLLTADLGGGERLTGRWGKLDEDVLTLRLPWGDALAVPTASLSRLEVQNGRLLYLSTLQPTEVRHTPYLDGSFPVRRDLAVSGRPLRLGGRTYSRGLGMHSRTEATYSLDGKYAQFASLVGMDDAVADQGSVVFRVYGDEKLLYQSSIVRGGETPIEVKVDVKRVLLLRLEVDFADQGDVADHANWADARLLKD